MLPDRVDAAPLITKLVEKSQASKIPWESTAEDNTFVAAVGKNRFRIRLKDISQEWEGHTNIVPTLELFDEQNRLVWTVLGSDVPELFRLHDLAQRIGNRVDERLDELISALDELD